MVGHTPGPWRVDGIRVDRIPIVHSVSIPGAITANLAWVTARSTWIEEANANARLIAAAPDLLEALIAQAELSRIGLFTADEDFIERVTAMRRAAIAKATTNAG